MEIVRLPHQRVEFTKHPSSESHKFRWDFIYSHYINNHNPALITWQDSHQLSIELPISHVDLTKPPSSSIVEFKFVGQGTASRYLHASVPRPGHTGHWEIYGHRDTCCGYSQVFLILTCNVNNIIESRHRFVSDFLSPAPFTVYHLTSTTIYFVHMDSIEVFDLTLMAKTRTVKFPRKDIMHGGFKEAIINHKGNHLFVLGRCQGTIVIWYIWVIDTRTHESVQILYLTIMSQDVDVSISVSEDDQYIYVHGGWCYSQNTRVVRCTYCSGQYTIDELCLDLFSQSPFVQPGVIATVHGSNVLMFAHALEYSHLYRTYFIHWNETPTLFYPHISKDDPGVLKMYSQDLSFEFTTLVTWPKTDLVHPQTAIDTQHHLLYIVSDQYIWAYDYIHDCILVRQHYQPDASIHRLGRTKYAVELSPDGTFLALFAYGSEHSVLDIFDVQEVVWMSARMSVVTCLCDPAGV